MDGEFESTQARAEEAEVQVARLTEDLSLYKARAESAESALREAAAELSTLRGDADATTRRLLGQEKHVEALNLTLILTLIGS